VCALELRRVAAILASLALIPLVFAQQADAIVLPAQTIDGPNENIVGFGGVAMAEDGTGGLVYLKRVEGVAHLFVARYLSGHWLAPIRVDTEQHFAADWPRIGAADGGELVVVWTTPYATVSQHPVSELLSATMGPGASRFGPAVIVDPSVGEATGTSPDLVMSSTGQADVVYREVNPHGNAVLLRTGDVSEKVQVAHFNGERWTQLGEINRDPGISMRPPSEANAPQIAIGPTGNGVVVWQEPEIEGTARIWARRLFGSTLDYVMPVSAATFGGAPITEDADAPTVAVSRLGQAEVAYRQPRGAAPLPGPRIFLNVLPDGESAKGAEFQGAAIADSAVAGGRAAQVGRPSIDIDEKQEARLLYDSNGQPRVVERNDLGPSGTLSLGSQFVGSQLVPADELPSASVTNPEGGGIAAWPSASAPGAPGVAVREDFPNAAVQTGLVTGGAGGPIGALAVGRSGLGDGLVAFQQGPLGNAAIVAAQVTAQPQSFVISVTRGWLKPSQAQVSWEPAPSANGPVRYSAVLDGHVYPTRAGSSAFQFDPRGLGSGVHEVQVLATDIFGQATLTAQSKLLIDGQAPAVTVTATHGGHGVTVRVRDAQSGVDVHGVSVEFGDGQRASGRATFSHVYHRAGVFTIVAQVRDNIGNQGIVRRLVRVP